jgi:hypothetical protein
VQARGTSAQHQAIMPIKHAVRQTRALNYGWEITWHVVQKVLNRYHENWVAYLLWCILSVVEHFWLCSGIVGRFR